METLTSRSTFPKISTESQKTKIDQDYLDAYVTIPPDGGWGWMVVVGAFFCFLLVDGMMYSFGIFLTEMADDLGVTKSEVSVTAAISTGVFCFSGPFAASLVNNYGYRIVGITGSILSIISILAMSVSKSIYLIHLMYGVLNSLGFGLIYMPAVIAVGFYFEKWRGVATGIATCGAGLGGVALPIIFTVIQEKVGWRQTFKIIAALLVIAGICTLLFKPIPPTQLRRIRLNAMISGNFFTTYHNRMYPTLSQVTEVPTITLLQPRKLNKSSELMIMTYPSSSIRSKLREDEDIVEEPSKAEQRIDENTEIMPTPKNVTTIFISKRRQRKIPLHEAHTFFATSMRPMYRDDIFYNSSFNFLQKYKKTEQSSQRSKSNIEYHMSVTRVITSRDVKESKCGLCTEAIKRTLATMLDYNLMKSPSFLLIALHASFLCLGFFTTYIFIKDTAIQTGLPDRTAFWLISIIGVANTTGRIACGVLANIPYVDYKWLTVGGVSIGGIATLAYGHTTGAFMHIGYAIVYGLFVACIPVLRTLIIVDTLGLEKLTNSVGLILMFQGLTSLIGITIAGYLRQLTGDYKWSYYFSGIALIASGLIFIPLKQVNEWEKRKKIVNQEINVP